MTELGFRYRPLSTADQEAHAATVTLLAKDLSHVDPVSLELAAADWAKSERFMPKAVDLLDLIRKGSNDKQRLQKFVQANVERGNARLFEMGRNDVHWVVRDGRSVMEWK